MGRFRIGEVSSKPKKSLKYESSDNSELHKSLASLKSEIDILKTLPKIEQPVKIVEKVETIKYNESIKTIDSRARNYAKALKKLVKIQSLRNEIQDNRLDGQDEKIDKHYIELAHQRQSFKKIFSEIDKFEQSQKVLEDNILKEIQLLKKDKAIKFLTIGMALSMILSIVTLVLK